MTTPKFSLSHRVRMPVETPDAGKRPPLLLLLHGYGSNEADLFGLAPYTDRRFLVVSARAPYVLDAGSYAWFNLTFTERGIVSDMEEAERSLARLSQFVGELGEAYEFDAGRVYLMGFSQGAMLALGAALTEPERVAGVVAMSGRLSAGALEGKMAAPEALEGLPVFITHGTYDPMIPVEGARQTREALSKLPIALTYREYPMAHEVSLESLRDISAWLVARLDEDRRGSSSDVRDV